ncbi:MAG: polysaccharide deacetylase family protein [Austwickia sp.]|jgi:peptidoglycan/xylan/chitin deacetylase (PgdA/CDA1 family)|nr:MAG: polysaccharide deacetylase family protein [Austwickia sp.]
MSARAQGLRASLASVDRGLLLHRAKLEAGDIMESVSPAALGVLASVRTTRPRFAMTYDDGPHPLITPRILEVLARWDAKAVFFVLVGNALAHPATLEAVCAAGHEVGLHGMDHRHILGASAAQLTTRLREGRDRLADLTGRPVIWYRPPHGLVNRVGHRVVRDLGMTPVHWNRTGWDWNATSEERRATVATMGVRRGNIILLHDAPNEADPGCSLDEVLDIRSTLTERILATYAAAGLQADTLSEALTGGSPSYRTHLNWSAKTATYQPS